MHIDRAPRFRILVGDTRKKARWVEVNPVQYFGCGKGDEWTGRLCRKPKLARVTGAQQPMAGHTPFIAAIGAAMVAVPVVGALLASRHD